ncbi:MAG: hypothetical protein Q8M07_23310 [Prosthecobacter sp.]|nr:hypothetical protein [Prosthecobacter sp.]
MNPSASTSLQHPQLQFIANLPIHEAVMAPDEHCKQILSKGLMG